MAAPCRACIRSRSCRISSVRHLRGLLTAGRLCTKNTSRALIERPYSCAPQAVGAVYDRPVPPRESIGLEGLGDLLRIAGPAEHQTQKDASLLWIQIVPRNNGHLAKIPARGDSSGRSSTRLYDDHTTCLYKLQRLYLQRSYESRRETGHDDSGCPRRGRCFDQSAIGARIRVNDVHTRQG